MLGVVCWRILTEQRQKMVHGADSGFLFHALRMLEGGREEVTDVNLV